MIRTLDKKLKGRFHWSLFWVTVLLSTIGLMTLYSATFRIGEKGLSPLFTTQLISFGIGYVALLVLFAVDYRILERGSFFFYLISIGLLLLVLLVGKTVAGHKSWLVIGSFSLQPSELAKITLIFVLARFFAQKIQPEGHTFGSLWLPFLYLLIPLGLVLLQKDLGSSLFFILIFASYIFFAGVRKKTVLVLIVLAMAAGGVGYAKFLKPHQKARIQTFLHPTTDPKGKGYHLLQSKITVGSGGLIGKGYLDGIHHKLLYLPEKHSDFIFPVLAEEWGFVGSVSVLFLFFLMVYFGLGVSAKAKDGFGVCLAFGITSLLFWQVVINLGGVLGLIPLTGVTLPLLSYGGSSVITILAGIGLLLNIALRRFSF